MTRYVAIFEKVLPTAFNGVHWHPWLNVDDESLLPQIAAYRHIRDRGGVLPDEEPLRVFVCISDRDEGPRVVNYTHFSIRKT